MLFQRFSIIWIFSLEVREADVLGAFLPIAIIASTFGIFRLENLSMDLLRTAHYGFIVSIFHLSGTPMFLIILLATSTVLIPFLNQNQIGLAQQQNNQTSSSLTNQQQPNGISFQIDNTTFSHHMAVVNGVQIHYVIGGHGDPVVLLHGWPGNLV